MELRQLKYFVKAAELSNFTAASQALFITQSTLSQQIKQLEDELDVPLFDRVAKRVRLTEAGRLFLASAIKTIKEAEDGKQLLKDLGKMLTGSLSIGATYGLSDLLTKKLIIFAATYPMVKININYGTSSELLELLERGKIDFVLSFFNATDNPDFESDVLFKSVLSLIVHKDHELAGCKEIPLKQLSGLPLVLPVDKFSIREALDKQLESEGIGLNPCMEINNIYTLLQLTETKNWCTILMDTSLFNFPQLRAVPLKGKAMYKQATITWPKDVYRKKAASLFAGLIEGNRHKSIR